MSTLHIHSRNTSQRWPLTSPLWLAVSLLLAAKAGWAGTLSGTRTQIDQGTDINLTVVGTMDWVHWGLYTDSSLNRKSSATPQISDFNLLGANYPFAFQYADNYNTYSWSDGTPQIQITATPTGVWAYDTPLLGSGFQFTVPADTELKTLHVYVGAFAARGRFVASLSDGSARDYSDSGVMNMRNGPSHVYAISFAADSPGQTLTISYTLSSMMAPDGNVTLQAAALAVAEGNNPPLVALTSPQPNDNVPANSDLILEANASDTDGSILAVQFHADDMLLGEDNDGPPYTLTWTQVPAGHYSLAAVATDDQGRSARSAPVEIFVHRSGGQLTAAHAVPPPSVNLTEEGEVDWVHLGHGTNAPFNRKVDMAHGIRSVDILGTNSPVIYSNHATAFSWSDGDPVLSATDLSHGVYVTGHTNGFLLTAHADTAPRQLKVYVGLYGATARFQAFLSDFSAMAYTDLSLSNVFGDSLAVYTLTYAAAAPNQTLVVRYQTDQLFDQDYGNVTMQAATLAGGGPIGPLPVTLVNPALHEGRFLFSFESRSETDYALQFSPLMSATNWITVATRPGTGEPITVTNELSAERKGFFRVISQ